MTRLQNWTELAEQFRLSQLAGEEPPDSFWGNLRARIAAWCRQQYPNDPDDMREDIVQESCIRVYTHRHTIRTETFGAYIQTIIRNIRTDILKSHAKHAKTVTLDCIIDAADPNITVFENAMLHAAIEPYLTPTERAILRYIEEGYTIREIASKIGYATHRCHAFRRVWNGFTERMRTLLGGEQACRNGLTDC